MEIKDAVGFYRNGLITWNEVRTAAWQNKMTVEALPNGKVRIEDRLTGTATSI